MNILLIKSFYILKKIFSYMMPNKKLELISYNKNFQSKLGINFDDYKIASNKYKIEEINGTGKEYLRDTQIIIFEGNYLNGKRNGQGKEYYKNGKIKFQGEYLNGNIINGKGYDIDGYEYLNLNNGYGKEYYDNGKIRFEGEYYKGRKWNGIYYNYQGKKEFEIKCGRGIVKEYNKMEN